MGVVRTIGVVVACVLGLVGLSGCGGGDDVVGTWTLDVEHAKEVMRAEFESAESGMGGGMPDSLGDAMGEQASGMMDDMREAMLNQMMAQVEQMEMRLVVNGDGTFTARSNSPMPGKGVEEVSGTWSGADGVYTFDVEGEEPMTVRLRDGALFFTPETAEGDVEMKLVRE